MALPRLFPNYLAQERTALALSVEAFAERAAIDPQLYRHMEEGRILPSSEEFDRILELLGRVEPDRIFAKSLLGSIGASPAKGPLLTDLEKQKARETGVTEDEVAAKKKKVDYQAHFDSYRDGGFLLVTPEEMKVIEQDAAPDRAVDVFVNLSCGTQRVPDLMLDIVSVLRALGLDVASGVGRQFCCGTLYRRNAHWDAANRLHDAALARELAWGASTVAHMCTQCTNTYAEVSHRRAAESGEAPRVTHTQVLRLIDERLAELGDRVPWKKEVRARVLGHGHPAFSYVHERALLDVGEIAKRIPGVEFVGFLGPISLNSFCMGDGAPQRPRPTTREEVEAYRAELADIARERGADTIAAQHQGCYQYWTPFASEAVAVRHIVGLLAEALGVAHPSRYQAASRLGDPKAVVEQTRPIWTVWGLTETKATEIATSTFGDIYGSDACACAKSGAERCGHDDVISLDTLVHGVASAR
jgi:Fe-S oxidoreductase